MKNNPILGTRYLAEGFSLVLQPGLRLFVLLPLLVNTLLLGLMVWLGAGYFEQLMDRFLPDSSWLNWLRWLLWPLFAISLALLLFYSFTSLANLIAAPFNSLLSEKVVQRLTAETADDSQTGIDWRQLLRDIPRDIGSELRKILYFLTRAVPLLILFLIPGLNLLAPFVWLAFTAWYLALEYMDYPLANQGVRFREQHQILKQGRMLMLGFGGSATLLMMVPVLNLAAMPIAVAGASALWVREIRVAEKP
jgi:CysZ protein